VAAYPSLTTRDSLADDLGQLGVRTGDTLLIHASMRAIGWLCGGATTAVHALLDAVGPPGTLVVPAQTPYNRDPSRWAHAPVPREWWPEIRAHLPAFDPELDPATAMGAIAERIRTWPGAVRSTHPQTSFAAVGRLAGDLMHGHAVESQLGEQSPLARLEKVDGRILLLGVGFEKCTAFHLAEYRLSTPPLRMNSCVVNTPAGRQWLTYQTVALDDSDFGRLGADFEVATGLVVTGKVGAATSRLLPLPDAVRFAAAWFPRHRDASNGVGATEENGTHGRPTVGRT
jgi:aminoglycoside 3-N-acetyltransferase